MLVGYLRVVRKKNDITSPTPNQLSELNKDLVTLISAIILYLFILFYFYSDCLLLFSYLINILDIF